MKAARYFENSRWKSETEAEMPVHTEWKYLRLHASLLFISANGWRKRSM